MRITRKNGPDQEKKTRTEKNESDQEKMTYTGNSQSRSLSISKVLAKLSLLLLTKI